MIVVTSTADSGAGTLRQAIADATAGEEITFSITGVIALTSAALTISQDVVITGPGSTNLEITLLGGPFRIFDITAGQVSIGGLNLTNGNDVNGGIIQNATTLALYDVRIFAGIASGDGGGIWNSSSVTMMNCEVTNNNATGTGGAIFNSGTLTTIATDITGNTSSGDGGGIYNSGTAELTRGDFSGNANPGSGGKGGGIYNSGTITLTEIEVASNQADTTDGDAIYNSFGTVYLTRTTVTGHIIPGSSAIYNRFGSLYLINCTISGNTDEIAIMNDVASANVSNSTIVENATGVSQSFPGMFTFYNTILCGNTTQDLTAVAAAVTSNGANILGTYSNAITPGTGDQIGVAIAAVMIGPLQNNGGPTFTHELLTGSVAIDAGNNTSAPATDQRGEPRVVNGTIDIGAYESEPPGGLIFTGTLPGWLSIANDCLVVTSGSFRANTPAAADAAAQAALDTFVADNLASGDLSCGAAGPCASAPQFATTTQSLTIDGTTTSPNRPGKFNKLVTFSGTAGDTVNIWMDSLLYDCYLYLMDPGNIVVASDPASGYIHGPPSISSSVLHYTLLTTGTYTIDCTTYDAGKTGAFTLVISSDPIAENTFGVDNGNYLRDIVYATNANRIVCFNQIGNATADSGIFVASGCTGELLATFFMPGSAPPGFIYNALGACYNSTNGLIYVAREDGTLFTFNALTYEFAAIASNVINPTDNGHGMVYDPVNDRLFIGVFTSGIYTDKGIRVFDCATNTEIALVDVGGSGAGWVAYADTGFIYCTVGTTVKKMDCSTLAVTSTALVCATNDRLYSVVERQLLLVNTTITGGIMPYNIVDYTTDAILDTRNGSVSGIQGAVWDPYRNRILISSYGDNTLTFGCGVAFYSPDTAVIDNFISISEATIPVYSTEANSVFVSNRSYAILYKIV